VKTLVSEQSTSFIQDYRKELRLLTKPLLAAMPARPATRTNLPSSSHKSDHIILGCELQALPVASKKKRGQEVWIVYRPG
jgi:hypothetical protein